MWFIQKNKEGFDSELELISLKKVWFLAKDYHKKKGDPSNGF